MNHTLEVIELTSAAGWKPSYLSDNSFAPGADNHYYHKSGYKVNSVSSTWLNEIMWLYSLNWVEYLLISFERLLNVQLNLLRIGMLVHYVNT